MTNQERVFQQDRSRFRSLAFRALASTTLDNPWNRAVALNFRSFWPFQPLCLQASRRRMITLSMISQTLILCQCNQLQLSRPMAQENDYSQTLILNTRIPPGSAIVHRVVLQETKRPVCLILHMKIFLDRLPLAPAHCDPASTEPGALMGKTRTIIKRYCSTFFASRYSSGIVFWQSDNSDSGKAT